MATVPRSESAVRGARMVTAAYGAAAATSLVLLLLTLGRPHHISWVEDAFGLLNIPVSRSLVAVVVLAMVTRALLARQRLGLAAVALFQVAGIYLGIASLLRVTPFPALSDWQARGTFGAVLDVGAAVIGVAALVWLARLRPAFPARPAPGSWLAAGTVLAVGSAISIGATWLALRTAGHPEARTLWRQLEEALEGSLGSHDRPWTHPGTPGWIPQLASVLVSLTLVLAVVAFLRSARLPEAWSGERELALRALLREHGHRDSLGYFATRRDKASVFSPDGRAAVTYRVISGVVLASGDPIGDPASWGGAIEAWLAEARTHGWLPAAISVSEQAARVYARHGLGALPMGDEAILHPAAFDPADPDLAAVRHAARHAAARGLTVQVRRQQDLPADELTEILACADRWRGDEPDRGFSMALNRFGDPADGRMLFVTARDAHGVLRGVLGFVPWGRRGVSLDLMRRSPQAPNGVTELMVSELLSKGRALRIDAVSLNFVMFRSVYSGAARVGSGPLLRLNHSVLGYLDRFWQLERLYRSNEKYRPVWSPRFLCLEDWVSLPQVGLAAGQAEGFLPTLRLLSSHAEARLTDDELAAVQALEQGATAGATDQVPSVPAARASDQVRHRLQRLQALESAGSEGYPVGRGDALAALAAARVLAETPAEGVRRVTVSGRVRAVRAHGGVVFVDLVNGADRLQVLFDAQRLGRARVTEVTRLIDRGDLVVVDGVPGASRRGEPSLLADAWQMSAKCLHPVPFGSFTDPDARLRQRATDLIVHPDDLEALRTRGAVVASVRAVLGGRGFLEVETPILQVTHGGATARPFRTHINAYDLALSLRIAPELYLKRLLVAGVGPLFELGRSFRNEGADTTHNPEFTSLEAYLPHGDYTAMRRLTEEIVTTAARAVHGRCALPLPLGPDSSLVLTDVTGPWPVVPVLRAVSDALGVEVYLDTPLETLRRLAREHAVGLPEQAGPGTVIEELYGELVEPRTIHPTFYVDFPTETSPLTRPHRTTPGLAERWDLVIAGMEVGTAYTELTDPREQRRRLVAQSLKAADGDPEAMEVDEAFLRDLEMGMPPSGGLGIGVDRLVMVITGRTIRQVLSFPFVKPLRAERRVESPLGASR